MIIELKYHRYFVQIFVLWLTVYSIVQLYNSLQKIFEISALCANCKRRHADAFFIHW